jgi:FkbM family methyltransferase
MSLKSLLGSFLRSRHYHVFHEEHLAQANLSLHLRRLFATQGIDCVFDVGANRGQYHAFLRDAVGYHGLVISVEPIPELRGILEAKAQADSQWVVLSCAVGRTPGIAAFNIMKGDQLSSFRTPTTTSTVRFHESNTVVAVEQVEVRRLDDVFEEMWQRFRFERPYLKIDTQGFDLEVAEGASACLSRFVALQSEANITPLYEGIPSLDQTLDYFRSRGLVPSFFSPIGIDQQLRLLDLDCVFVNPAHVRELQVERY